MLGPLVVALTLLSCTCGQNPAVQVALTNKGLQYGKHAGAGWIQERLGNVTLPDISGGVFIGIGTVHYTLTGTTVTKCDLPEPSVEFLREPAGLKTSILGLSVALAGGWRTRFGAIHDSGSIQMAIFNLSVTSAVQLGKDANGHLSVASAGCDAQVADVAVQLEGGASWIIQRFLDHFKGHVIRQIQSQLCPLVEKYISTLETDLQTMNVSFAVDQLLTLDLPLTGSPVTDASNLTLGFKGEFYTETHTDPPFKAQQFTLPDQPKRMLSVGVSNFTLNSASFGYFSAGRLQAVINDSMVFKRLHVHLNTTSMGRFIPQLPKMFPDLLMTLRVYATEAPQFSFHPGAAELHIPAAVKAFAIEPNGTQVPLFKLNISISFSGQMWIGDGKLKALMKLESFTLTLVSTEVGTFDTGSLEKGMKTAVQTMVLFKVNKILGEGIVLPRMKNVQLVNPILTMENGFIAVSSDAEII